MSILPVPKLDPREYHAFLTLPNNDFPKTFKEWERYIGNKSDKHAFQWKPPGDIQEVKINPSEFTAYCRATKSKCTVEAVERLAAEKSTGERK
jgi:hypothetical protein